MLAVSRPTVSVAAGTLQAAGTIEYRRGKISILDREALGEVLRDEPAGLRASRPARVAVPLRRRLIGRSIRRVGLEADAESLDRDDLEYTLDVPLRVAQHYTPRRRLLSEPDERSDAGGVDER